MKEKKDSVIVDKPWGFEAIWAQTDDYVGKMLHIVKSNRLSRQYHEIKEETIHVLEGLLTLEIGHPDADTFQVLKMNPGETFHITPGLIHRFCAYDSDVKICEVSTPHLSDVVRLEDDYSR